MLELSQAAKGPAAAGLIAPVALAKQGLSMGAGLVQSMVAAAIAIVPPLIPPPVWNNQVSMAELQARVHKLFIEMRCWWQPLTCAPMVTGHNCFGAVLYPITMHLWGFS